MASCVDACLASGCIDAATQPGAVDSHIGLRETYRGAVERVTTCLPKAKRANWASHVTMFMAKFSAEAWVQATVAWNSEAGLPVLGTTSLEGQPWQTRTSTQSDAASGPATDGSCPRECPDGLATPGLPPSATLPRLNVPLGGSAVLPLGLASVAPGQTHAVAVRGRHEFRSHAADPSPYPRMDLLPSVARGDGVYYGVRHGAVPSSR